MDNQYGIKTCLQYTSYTSSHSCTLSGFNRVFVDVVCFFSLVFICFKCLFLFCAASRWRSHSLAEEIQPEIWIAQELRRIGDEFNASYCPRRVIFLFLLSISLHLVSKREKLNHIWKLALRQVFRSLKCRKGCAGGCIHPGAGACCLRCGVARYCSVTKRTQSHQRVGTGDFQLSQLCSQYQEPVKHGLLLG